jgi:hypothetical protein
MGDKKKANKKPKVTITVRKLDRLEPTGAGGGWGRGWPKGH